MLSAMPLCGEIVHSHFTLHPIHSTRKGAIFSIKMNNVRDINYFTKKFTNSWCDEWLLENEKVILMVSSNENQ